MRTLIVALLLFLTASPAIAKGKKNHGKEADDDFWSEPKPTAADEEARASRLWTSAWKYIDENPTLSADQKNELLTDTSKAVDLALASRDKILTGH